MLTHSACCQGSRPTNTRIYATDRWVKNTATTINTY